jgi:hypothetical protein
MSTTLQPDVHATQRCQSAPIEALMPTSAPLSTYLAQRLVCRRPASGRMPSTLALYGRQYVDGSLPSTAMIGTE